MSSGATQPRTGQGIVEGACMMLVLCVTNNTNGGRPAPGLSSAHILMFESEVWMPHNSGE